MVNNIHTVWVSKFQDSVTKFLFYSKNSRKQPQVVYVYRPRRFHARDSRITDLFKVATVTVGSHLKKNWKIVRISKKSIYFTDDEEGLPGVLWCNKRQTSKSSPAIRWLSTRTRDSCALRNFTASSQADFSDSLKKELPLSFSNMETDFAIRTAEWALYITGESACGKQWPQKHGGLWPLLTPFGSHGSWCLPLVHRDPMCLTKSCPAGF